MLMRAADMATSMGAAATAMEAETEEMRRQAWSPPNQGEGMHAIMSLDHLKGIKRASYQ